MLNNELLNALPDTELVLLHSNFERVSLEKDEVLYKRGARMEHVYFPEACLIALMAEIDHSVGVAVVGRRGLLAPPVVARGVRSRYMAVVQISGPALRMGAASFEREFQRDGTFQALVLKYSRHLTASISQTAICNHSHPLQRRFARFLLTIQDEFGEEYAITQNFISGMLGAACQSAGRTMNIFHENRWIDYTAGKVRILDRHALEASACPCYGIIERM